MTTSLAQQLKQLSEPQTRAILGSDTRRVSFIYDPKKAASIDRETFHCLGANGLGELCVLDEAFEEYEASLFSHSAVSFERSIQTQEVNEQLDRSIDSFLLRLSPFLQLTCAQLALEWLIQRYRIHLNNVDSLVQCFLPYHEVDLFARMLKLIDLKSHKNRKWAWLLPIQKSAIHLTRQVLVNHCRADPSCLAIITDMVPLFLKVYDRESKHQGERLRMVINFYALTLLGLVQSGPVTERVLSAILPVVCRGLKSAMIDYKAASYVIISSVMSKTTLKTGLLETIMNGVCKNLNVALMKEGLSTLLVMFQSQEIDKVTKKSFKRLSRLWGLPSTLALLSARSEVSRFVAAIFKRLIPAAVKESVLDATSGSSSSYSSEDEAEGPRPTPISLVHDLLAQVTLDTETRTLAARLMLENFVEHCGNDSVDQQEVVGKIKHIVRIFETRYSDSLDAAVDIMVSSTEDKRKRNMTKEFLNLAVSSVHHRLIPNSQTTLALSLHHPNTSVRLNAVKYLLDNLDSIDDKESTKESFLARLQDDSSAVVKLLLKNPQKLWSVFTDKSELTAALISRLKIIDTSVNKVDLVREILEVLTQGEVSSTLETVVLSYLLLCPSQSSPLDLVIFLLSSPLVAGSSLLSPLMKGWLPKVQKLQSKSVDLISDDDLSALNVALFDTLATTVAALDSPVLQIGKLMSEIDVLSPLRQKCLACILGEVNLRVAPKVKDTDTVSQLKLQFSHLLHSFLRDKKLLSQRSPKSSPMKTKSAPTPVTEVISHLSKGRHLPMSWWRDLLNRWIASLDIPKQLKDMEFWQEVSADSVEGRWLCAVVKVTNVLLHLKSDLNEAAKEHIAALQKVLGSVEVYLRYQCVLWSGENCMSLGVTANLRDRGLQLMQTYLSDMSEAEATAIVQSSAPVIPCLLGLCVSDVDTVRTTALSMISTLSEKCSSNSALYKPVLDHVIHYREEITADTTYLATALTGLKQKASRRKSKQVDTLSSLLKVVESPHTPTFITSALLQALSGIDTMDTLTPLLPLLSRLLEQDLLSQGQMEVIQLLLARYTDTVALELSHDQLSLQLLTEAIKTPLATANSMSVQQLAMSQITKKFFAALPSLESQRSVAGSLLDVLQATTDTDVSTLIRKVFKHVSLPADLLSGELAPVLHTAATSVREVKRMRREDTEEKSTFSSAVWIRTTVLLEIMQAKKKIPHSSKLVPVCFQILTKVLEVENAGEGEYLKQLTLGVIRNLCKKHSTETDPIDGKDLQLESIVQCIRSSSSPHTHQHALFVLSEAAHIAPEQLLHSMMSVFTFMGASILRQDDSYSFQVITRILETVFPALVMACSEHKQHKVVDMVTMILRVFVDTYPHIPEHRKLMVFTTLLRVVGVEEYLWRLLLVFIEGVATRTKAGKAVTDSSEPSEKAKAIEQVHVDFLISLVLEFSVHNCVQMAHQAVQYLAKMPDEKTEGSKQKERRQSASVIEATKEECEIFSLAYHTSKQLHKFKHATVLMLHQLLASRQFIAQIAANLDDEIMQAVKQLLETVLAYMSQTSQATDRYAATPHALYWKGLMVKCNMLLDSLVSLLPQDQFLMVVCDLLDSPMVTVQRKAQELLASRLRHIKDTGVTPQQKAVLMDMVPKLQKMVQHLRKANTAETEEKAMNGRIALYTLMLMVRVLGMEYHVTFVEVLKQVCQVMTDQRVNSEVAATAMMCAAEVVSNIRAYAIVHLPLIVPAILQQLQAVSSVENEMLACCVTSLHKVMDTLPHFLTPYIQDILTEVCHIQTVLEDAPFSEQGENIMKSLKHTSKSIAGLPPRLFLPTVEKCYTTLLESRKQESIIGLLSVMSQHLSDITREDLHLNHQQLLEFFLVALDFRVIQRKEVSSDVIDKIEGAVIETILAMVLKMTEGTLRPMLLKMFEWATKEGKRDRVIAFYRLSDCLAGKLRGLFLLFAAHIFKHAAQLLDLLHTGKADEPYLRKDKKGKKSAKLLTSLLGCLQKVCLFDTQNFINKERFHLLLQPLLDQVENFVGGEDLYRQRVQQSLVPAIADFAGAAKNDSLWQNLNYQLMLKTRSKKKEVRLSALHALKGLHRKLAEDYVSLMPETIPFLSELMEDDCEEVEALTQEVIQDMEVTFGEPLQKYFN